MKKINKIIILVGFTGMVMFFTACKPSDSTTATTTIGIIEPLEHKAMDEIVSGFTATLKEKYKKPFTIRVENAQNDLNLQRAIIQKMQDAHYAMIVPIGTDATQMTLAMNRHQAIVSLASSVTATDRKKLTSCHVAIVHDEIPTIKLIDFIHAAYPKLTQLILIHSTADKVFPEVKEAIAAGKTDGIQIMPRMVSSLPELYTAASSLPENTQGIFVLKDSLIVSGISTLSKEATNRHIPLITSDQGSVQDGAYFSLGVHEREIGSDGAILAASILNGQAACDLPIVEMKKLTVFINQSIAEKTNQSITAVINTAKKLGYEIEVVGQDNKT